MSNNVAFVLHTHPVNTHTFFGEKRFLKGSLRVQQIIKFSSNYLSNQVLLGPLSDRKTLCYGVPKGYRGN